MADQIQLSVAEAIELSAKNSEFYCRTFFPKTVRQPFAPFHHDAWGKLESNNRLVNLLMYRGSGKTSHCRLYTSKSIAYAISRTILYVGKSEAHAIRSTNWLKKAVEVNSTWNESYHIRQGGKWQDVEFEIIVGPDEIPIWVMAAGINGSIRGINRDDYRPDLIVLDDVLDDENANTADQRDKISNLVYGALLESLAPEVDAPHAKMIGLNTPQNKEDFAVQALKDPSWLSAVYGCWTRETADMPIAMQESAWPDRVSSEILRAEKHSAAARNMLTTFLREKECKLTSPETASFKLPWLKRYARLPENMTYVYAIDPVPPPSEIALQKGMHRKDFEAHVVWGARGSDRFLAHYELMRGHEPTWTVMKFFEIQQKFRPVMTLVDTVAYQQTLMWLIKQAMDHRKAWFAVTEYPGSRRSKYSRIVNAHNGPAVAGRLYVRADQTEFLEQFGQYPAVNHDDLLDASSMALERLEGLFFDEAGNALAAGGDDPFVPAKPLFTGWAP